MSIRAWLVPARLRGLLMAVGAVSLVATITGLVLGLILVQGIADDLEASIGVSGSAVHAIGETLSVVETMTAEIDDGLVTAAESISAASRAADDAAGRLQEVADFLDGELRTNIETLQRSMPAAVQAAGAIDDTLSALSLFGVAYDPEEPFDVSLMAMEEALSTLPDQLSEQADAIRGLVPASRRFGSDAAALSESLSTLDDDLDTTGQLVDSYRATLEQAQGVIGDTDSALDLNMWLLRLLFVVLALAGTALSVGMILVGKAMTEVAALITDATDRVLD